MTRRLLARLWALLPVWPHPIELIDEIDQIP